MTFASRPDTEIRSTRDLPAEALRLPGATSPLRLIALSRSAAGGTSAVLLIPPGWTRAAGANPATFLEVFRLSGDLEVGGRQL